jgi:Tetratricopeptide repeat
MPSPLWIFTTSLPSFSLFFFSPIKTHQSLTSCLWVWGSHHPETAESMHDLAQFREAQGNREEARTWYARALEVREQVLGASHPKTVQTRKRLIALLHTMGQHEEGTQIGADQAELSSMENSPEKEERA